MSTVRPEKVRGKYSNVSRELARMMVGREVILEIGKESCKKGRPLLQVEQLSVKGDRGELAVKNVSFSVNAGEVFAILGVAGNGQRELVEALVGLREIDNGKVLLEGGDMSAGLERVGYIPEDRNERGSVPDMQVLENFALTGRDRFTIGPLMRWKTAAEETRRRIVDFNIAAPNIEMKARQLSGGNLQKLILAREFSRKPFLFIAEQPTRGLDIGATEEIWQAILKQRETGGVLIVSGDLKETLSLADTIMVIFRGQVMDIIACEDDDAIADIGPLMAGVKKKQ
jgi:simple sugar transport system ATP-binding protein